MMGSICSLRGDCCTAEQDARGRSHTGIKELMGKPQSVSKEA